MGCSSLQFVPTTCSTSWPPCVQLGVNATTSVQAQTNRKLATSCPTTKPSHWVSSMTLFRSPKSDKVEMWISFVVLACKPSFSILTCSSHSLTPSVCPETICGTPRAELAEQMWAHKNGSMIKIYPANPHQLGDWDGRVSDILLGTNPFKCFSYFRAVSGHTHNSRPSRSYGPGGTWETTAKHQRSKHYCTKAFSEDFHVS